MLMTDANVLMIRLYRLDEYLLVPRLLTGQQDLLSPFADFDPLQLLTIPDRARQSLIHRPPLTA